MDVFRIPIPAWTEDFGDALKSIGKLNFNCGGSHLYSKKNYFYFSVIFFALLIQSRKTFSFTCGMQAEIFDA